MAFLTEAANRGSISTGYDIDNSLKFEPDNTEYMRRSNGTDGNQRVFTQSMWIKRTELGYSYATPWCVGNVALRFDSNDRLEVWCYTYDGTGAGTSNVDSYRIYTAEKFRDTSAWYHLVFALDTTQGTESNRLKVYVNNQRVYHDPSAGSDIYDQTITQNSYTRCNGTGNSSENWNQIGWFYSGNYVFAGYIAEVNFVDGLQLSPTDVAEYDDSGIWIPKQYTGAYGTNGYYLKFDDASDLGADSSGSSHDMNSIGNITAADQATDTPTNNFCTLNVIANIENNAVVFTEGATVGSVSGGGNVSDHAMATMGFSSGKWYYEAYVTTGSTSDDAMFGFANTNGWYQGLGNYTFSAGAHNVGRWYYNSNTYTTTGATAWDKGDIVQIAIDCDNGKCWSGVNGTYSSGDPSTNTGGFDWDANVTNMSIGDLVIPVTRVLYTAPGTTYYNFGGYTTISISSAESDANGYGTFEYAPPTGFHAICTKNLAEYG